MFFSYADPQFISTLLITFYISILISAMALLSYEDPHMFVLVVVLTTDKQSEISSQLFVYCWTRVSGCEFCEDHAFSKLVSHFSGFRMLVSVGFF